MRQRLMTATVLTAGLALAPAAATAQPAVGQAPAGWHTLNNYCSPTGDFCYGIQYRGETVRFVIRSFVDFGPAHVCVKKVHRRHWVCHKVALRPGKHSVYTGKIRWQGNYPSKGHAKRVVSFMRGTPRLTFRP